MILRVAVIVGLLGTVGKSETVSAKLAKYAATGYGGFTVDVSYAAGVKEALLRRGESVIVAAYFNGVPAAGVRTQGGDLSLGRKLEEIVPGTLAHFGDFTVAANPQEEASHAGRTILINVYSGRKSSKNNLLDCGIYQGPLAGIEGRSIPIHCRLLGA